MLLDHLAPDKAKHIIAGALVAAVFAFAGLFVSGAAVAVAAVMREVYNKFDGGKFDLLDIAFTLGGGAIVWLALLTGTV